MQRKGIGHQSGFIVRVGGVREWCPLTDARGPREGSVRQERSRCHPEMIGEPVQHPERDVLLTSLKAPQIGAMHPDSPRHIELGLITFLAQRAQTCPNFC